MKNKAGKSVKILLIEDEPDINLISRKALEIRGYEVLWALNGPDGINLAQKEQVDLILLDVSMPEMDGYEVMEIIRAHKETRHIPVVFFSALVLEGEVQKGLSLGALGYIRKPFDPITLPDEVGKYLKNHQGNKLISTKQINCIDEGLRKEYLFRMDEKLSFLKQLLKEKDFDTIIRIGHQLEGSGASYGFPELSDIGSQIKSAGKEKNGINLKYLNSTLSKIIIELKSTNNMN